MTWISRLGLGVALVVLGCALAGSAQNRNTAQAPAAQNSTASYGVNPAAANSNEDRITREVRHQLLMLPYYTLFDDLEYSVQGDTVTLKGYVVNPVNKRDAENAVKRVEGVQHVVNDIEVAPPFPSDDHIRREEYRAIYGSDGLYRYGMAAVPSIHIIVRNGRVTLKGVVDNQGDKDLINVRANSVPGVFSVTNDLVVVNQKTK